MRHQIIKLIQCSLLMGCLFCSTAFAAIFMCTADIKGDATLNGYQDCVEIDSFHDGVGRIVSNTGPTPGVSSPSFAEISLTKSFDSSSLELRKQAADGKGMDVNIHFVTAGESICEYYKIELISALFSSHSTSGTGDGSPYETLSIAFEKIRYTQFVFGKTGCESPSEITWGWDVRRNVPF